LHYKYKISYDKAWVANQKVFEHFYGSQKEFFEKLPRLLLAKKESNLRTTDDLTYIVFWSFGPCVEGFKYCRPIINVDEIYFYGRYGEKLLIAVAFDANNEIFPLAFCNC